MSVRETAATVLYVPWLARARGRDSPNPAAAPPRQQALLSALDEKRGQVRTARVPELDRLQALVATATEHCLEMRRQMSANDVAEQRPAVPPSPTGAFQQPPRPTITAGRVEAGAEGGGDEEEERDVTADDVMPRSPVSGHHYSMSKWMQHTSGSTADSPHEGGEERGPPNSSAGSGEAEAAKAPAPIAEAPVPPAPAVGGEIGAQGASGAADAAAAAVAEAEARPGGKVRESRPEFPSSGPEGEGQARRGEQQPPPVPGPPSRSRGKVQLARLHLPLPSVPTSAVGGDSEGDSDGWDTGPSPSTNDSEAATSRTPSTGRTLDECSSRDKAAVESSTEAEQTEEGTGGGQSTSPGPTPRGDPASGPSHASAQSISRASSDSSLPGPPSRTGSSVGAALSAVRSRAPTGQGGSQPVCARATRRKWFSQERASGSDSNIVGRAPDAFAD